MNTEKSPDLLRTELLVGGNWRPGMKVHDRLPEIQRWRDLNTAAPQGQRPPRTETALECAGTWVSV
jgi:hypothetical protein